MEKNTPLDFDACEKRLDSLEQWARARYPDALPEIARLRQRLAQKRKAALAISCTPATTRLYC